MSVVATVKVYDGIVLGAESMTQLTAAVPGQAQPQLIKSYENAQKLFQVGEFPVGVLTYGIGNIGRRSIESFVHEFSRAEKVRAPAPVDVEQIALRFCAFMLNHYTPAFGALPPDQQPAMGFVVAGYSHDQHLASEWEFVLPQDTQPRRVRLQDDVGASWRGVGWPFSRLIFGVDPTLEQALIAEGATPQEIQRLRNVAQKIATGIAFDGMPLADAIGFCKFTIQTTIGWCAYAIGSPLCGGPIHVAVITPGAGFQWVTPPRRYLEGETHAH